MPSKPGSWLDSLSAAVLAALLLCAHGAPFGANGPVVEPSGDKGETEWPSDTLGAALNLAIGAIEPHQMQLEDELHSKVRYDVLDDYSVNSFPAVCAVSDFVKEACLRWLLQGLQAYTVLLKYVERESLSRFNPAEARIYMGLLITEIKKEMRDHEQVTVLTSSQEELPLGDFDDPKAFHGKVIAHTILYKLRTFLIHCKRVTINRESTGGS